MGRGEIDYDKVTELIIREIRTEKMGAFRSKDLEDYQICPRKRKKGRLILPAEKNGTFHRRKVLFFLH